jgi:hypothetical protein
MGSVGFTVHPSAIVEVAAPIGSSSREWHFVHLCSGERIGERCPHTEWNCSLVVGGLDRGTKHQRAQPVVGAAVDLMQGNLRVF